MTIFSRTPQRRYPPPEAKVELGPVYTVFVQTAPADPETGHSGAVRQGYYVVHDGVVIITNKDGAALGNRTEKLKDGDDAKRVAARLLKATDIGRHYDFSKRLIYKNTFI
jgi:hypothetical protein